MDNWTVDNSGQLDSRQLDNSGQLDSEQQDNWTTGQWTTVDNWTLRQIIHETYTMKILCRCFHSSIMVEFTGNLDLDVDC